LKNTFQRIISYAVSIQSSRGVLVDLREKLAPFYSDIERPSIDPELMIRMLIVGYCYGIRFERKLCEEVKLHLGSAFLICPTVAPAPDPLPPSASPRGI
jgi:hypothetical protein